MYELTTLHPNGLFLRREALGFGYRDRDLADARRAGVVTRVRHGAYVAAEVWAALDEVGQHRIRAQAVGLTHGNRVALCHTSAAAEHGLRLWGVDLGPIHVLRLDGSTGGRQAGVVYHQGSWGPDDIYSKDELLLVSPERCALETASLVSVRSGLVTLDSVLDLDLGSEESLWATYHSLLKGSPRGANLHISLRMARKGAQSVAESLGRHLFYGQHIPEPQLQFHVYDDLGNLIGITDFAWPEYHLLGEFDGKIKYGRLLQPGQEPGDVVFAEKQREDLLREITQWAMIRFIWPQLFTPAATGERVRRMMRRSYVA